MRKKKIVTIILAGSLMLSIGSCGNRGLEDDPNTIKNMGTEVEQEEKIEETKGSENVVLKITQKNVDEDNAFSFAVFKNLEFYFSSGAGGWATQMVIEADGSFSGEYFDGEMGMTGENYPNGMMYRCDFSGQLTQPVKVNDYTYSMQIREMHYEKEVGTEEIKDGVLYCYTDAYGLEDAKDILIYLPGAPVAKLPEEFRSWIRGSLVNYNDSLENMDMELPFYALNNEENQYGFSSYDIVENLKEGFYFTEDYAAYLEESIKNDILTQTEYNEKTKELYELWDRMLNNVWDILKRTKDAETMRTLTVEELEWIALKEEAVEKAGADYEGGSIQPMVRNQKAAEMTKDRVYKLMEWFN